MIQAVHAGQAGLSGARRLDMTGLRDALRAEWTKLRTLSRTQWQCPIGKSGRNT